MSYFQIPRKRIGLDQLIYVLIKVSAPGDIMDLLPGDELAPEGWFE